MVHNFIDETGNRYGRLTVIQRSPRHKKKAHWICQCDCGTITTVVGYSLRSGNTQSCKCLRAELLGNKRRTHGKHGTPEYKIWQGMRVRCNTVNHQSYARYGAKGITIDPRWDDFATFLADMGTRPSPHHSIDRIDSSGPYSPENCRWATLLEQANNNSRVHQITHQGQTVSAAMWARKTGIGYHTLYNRLFALGWTPEKASTTPVRKISRKGIS